QSLNCPKRSTCSLVNGEVSRNVFTPIFNIFLFLVCRVYNRQFVSNRKSAGNCPRLNSSNPNMVGVYVETADTSTCCGMSASNPVAHKHALTSNRRKSVLWRSMEAPMVVANAFPLFPPGSWYSLVHAIGITSLPVFMGASALIPLVDCP